MVGLRLVDSAHLSRTLLIAVVLALVGFWMQPIQPAFAATYPCSQDGLNQAIADGGGPHNFGAGDCIITVTNRKIIRGNLILDGTGGGGTLTIDGGGFVQWFNIQPGADLTLNNLTLQRGEPDSAIYMWDGTLTINNSTIRDNAGRAIQSRASSTITINDSTFYNHHGSDNGGVIDTGGNLTITNSTFYNNSATRSGGVISYFGGVVGGGVATITNSTFYDNSAADNGGVLESLVGIITIDNSTFYDNSATIGGVTYNGRGSTVTISNSTFSGNSATTFGGVICNTINVNATIIGSTFFGNLAADGGVIYNNGSDTIAIINSTLSGNSATNDGGAIFNDGGGIVEINSSTFSGNSATNGGSIFNYDNGFAIPTLNITNSIVANSPSGGDCVNSGGIFNATEQNLDSDGTCPGFTITADPLLDALGDNGGPTQTHMPGVGSPAIDPDPASATCPASDQRGINRPLGLRCDIGAVEVTSTLAASAACNGNDLEVDITGGDNPFDITGTGPTLPQNGVGTGITILPGPGSWTAVTVAETAGDTESANLGNFTCPIPVVVGSGSSAGGGAAQVSGCNVTIDVEADHEVVNWGDQVMWTVLVTNPGPDDCHGVQTYGTMPGEFAITDISPSRGSLTWDGGQYYLVEFGTLTVSEQVTVTLNSLLQGGAGFTLPEGAAGQSAGQPICLTGYITDPVNDTDCVTLFPDTLPSTGGEPVNGLPVWAWILIASAGIMIPGCYLQWHRSNNKQHGGN